MARLPTRIANQKKGMFTITSGNINGNVSLGYKQVVKNKTRLMFESTKAKGMDACPYTVI